MTEQSYTRRFQELTTFGQPEEYRDILATADTLVKEAFIQHSTPRDKRDSRFSLFTDRCDLTQAGWEDRSTATTYHSDGIAVNLFQNALILGVHTRDAIEPHRAIVIGTSYANYHEHQVTRAALYDRPLDAEHLACFTEPFEAMVAKLGLTRLIQKTPPAEVTEIAA